MQLSSVPSIVLMSKRKFGKQIQKRQLEVPEYAASFVNYKALKKVCSIARLGYGSFAPHPRPHRIGVSKKVAMLAFSLEYVWFSPNISVIPSVADLQ